MNGKQAAKLRIGDRVETYGGDDDCPGTIIEANWCAVKIEFDDGIICILHHNDMPDVRRLEERYDVTRAIA